MNVEEIFDREIEEGIRRRFPEGMDDSHKERLAREVPVIKEMGYVDYHLIVKDFLEYGRLLGYVPKERIAEAPITISELKEFIHENGWKNPGMRIGPGRGSAVGSLVCYLLGITNLDPLKYDLLFERFLNPERVSMPDIDSDISATSRQKVIDFVKNKYGEGAVCGIMTTNAQAPKGAVRIAARFYGLKQYDEALTSLGNTIAKDVSKDVGISFATKVDNAGKPDKEGRQTLKEYLNNKYSTNKDALEVIRWACLIEGMFTSYGSHAAGIVISDNGDVSEYIPLRWNKSADMFTSQCDMGQIEDNGLLKFDFLGLKTLDIITEAMFMIEKNHGIIIDPLNINLEDPAVYKNIFAAGKTNSVFQFESPGMKNMLKRFKPASFNDLIILVSMYRPGPMQYLDGVIDVKNGVKPMEFMCPQLEPILGKTYGAIVYQEQVMQICQDLAGFTLGHADVVRRYMSKKKASKLAHERDAFVTGCSSHGIDESVSNALFNQMMDFAAYAFNKSHAAVYAYNAYITAWLKMYYPVEFFTAALNWTTTKKLAGLVYESKMCGVKVLAPDVNISGREYVSTDGCVRFGLSSVKGIKQAADAIVAEREKNGAYESLKDFIMRVRPNSKTFKNLADAGAFDRFSTNREAMKEYFDDMTDPLKKHDEKKSFIQSAEYILPIIDTLNTDEAVVTAQISNGMKAEVEAVTTTAKLSARIDNAKAALAKIDKEINLIRLRLTDEDKTVRLSKEKDLLGMYVTEHPMDFYPKAEEVGAIMTDSLEEGDTVIYGVVTNLALKQRKSDGATMAFFTIEDLSGSVDVAVFAKQYSVFGSMLKDGAVLKFKGRCEAEEHEAESEDEEPEITYKFYAHSAEKIAMKQKQVVIPVSSYAVFHAEIEDDFRQQYEDTNGYELILFDESLDEMREMTYRVKESVLTIERAKII